MEENMKENIEMIKKKDMEYFIGITERNIKDIGKMVNKMEKENFFSYRKKMEKRNLG